MNDMQKFNNAGVFNAFPCHILFKITCSIKITIHFMYRNIPAWLTVGCVYTGKIYWLWYSNAYQLQNMISNLQTIDDI